MTRNLFGLSALALVVSLSACGRTEEPTNNIAVEAGTNATMANVGPYADAEMQMSNAMKKAVGVNAGDTWVRKMIEHHNGAVGMSRIALAQNVTGDTAKMAQQTIDKQTKEIADLRKLIAQGAPQPASAQVYEPAEKQMHEAMMAATGADVSQTYLRKMLAHHQGAVAMSDIALANGAAGVVRSQVQKTRADQQMEVAMVEAMLRGEPMMTMPSTPAKADAAKASAEAAGTARPTSAKTSPKPKAPEPSVDPHAGMDMNNM